MSENIFTKNRFKLKQSVSRVFISILFTLHKKTRLLFTIVISLLFFLFILLICFENSSVYAADEFKITADDGISSDRLGWASAINAEGNRAIVGGDRSDNDGVAYIFERQLDGTWDQVKKLTDPYISQSNFGISVDINANGDKIVVGASSADTHDIQTGAAYIFQWKGGNNWELVEQLVPGNLTSYDNFGNSVDMSDDGNVIVVGAPTAKDDAGIDSGAAYVYVWNDVEWELNTKLSAEDGEVPDSFGAAVAANVNGKTIVVGTPQDDNINGENAGAVYIFKWTGSSWIKTEKLIANHGAANDFFGNSVDIDRYGHTFVVGAQSDDVLGLNAGAAYIYEWNGNTSAWDEIKRLTASDAQSNCWFGWDVVIGGRGDDIVIVGTYELVANRKGTAYVFERDAAWDETEKLTASDGEFEDIFGTSVAISSGNEIIAGAPLDDNANGENAGAVYVFTLTDSSKPPPYLPVTGATHKGGLGIHVRVSAEPWPPSQEHPNGELNAAMVNNILTRINSDKQLYVMDTVKAATSNDDWWLVTSHYDGLRSFLDSVRNAGNADKMVLVLRIDAEEATNMTPKIPSSITNYRETIDQVITGLETEYSEFAFAIALGNEPDLPENWPNGYSSADDVIQNWASEVAPIFSQIASDNPDVIFIAPGLSGESKLRYPEYYGNMYANVLPSNLLPGVHAYSTDATTSSEGVTKWIDDTLATVSNLANVPFVGTELGPVGNSAGGGIPSQALDHMKSLLEGEQNGGNINSCRFLVPVAWLARHPNDAPPPGQDNNWSYKVDDAGAQDIADRVNTTERLCESSNVPIVDPGNDLSIPLTNLNINFTFNQQEGTIHVANHQTTPSDSGGNLQFLNQYWDINASMSNTTFSADVTFNYTDQEIIDLGLNEQELKLFHSEDRGNTWIVQTPVILDIDANTIKVTTDHFSLWAIGAFVTANQPPTISLLEPDGVDDSAETSFTITWTDDDPDNDAGISLYYDTDNSGEDGTLIVEGLSEDDETDQYLWDTTNIADGTYYVYAVIDDGVNAPVVAYSDGPVTIVTLPPGPTPTPPENPIPEPTTFFLMGLGLFGLFALGLRTWRKKK